jgi:RNA polymerase sigma factor (sigma-70 family)
MATPARGRQGERQVRLIDRVRRVVLCGDGAGLSDGQLLERFRAQRDEAAFAALVKRHGPMVWGVCRRLLRCHHDAEDAFQAVFVVLSRKAALIRSPERVASWLHGVACHTAVRVRALSHKRQTRETPLGEAAAHVPAPPEPADDMRPVLDRELARLPDKYRAAVILCDLEGRTRREAAELLGVPQGTLSARLDRGRRLLASRLTRRGVGLSGLGLAALAQEAAGAAGPSSVLAAAGVAAGIFKSGKAAAAGQVPDRVAALAKGVMTTMLLTKLRSMIAVLVLVAVCAAGAAGLVYLAWAAELATPASDTGTPSAPVANDSPGNGGKKKLPAAQKIEALEEKIKELQARLDQALDQKEVLQKQLADVTAQLHELQKNKAAKAKSIVKVYPVGDLIPLAVGGPPAPVNSDKEGTALIQVITKTIEPNSWDTGGGTGTIQYFAPGKGLVIGQAPDIHIRVVELLQELRKVKLDQEKKFGMTDAP